MKILFILLISLIYSDVPLGWIQNADGSWGPPPQKSSYATLNLEQFLEFNDTDLLKKMPNEMIDELNEAKNEINTYQKIFQERLNLIFLNLLKPYMEKKWITTSTGRDEALFNYYTNAGLEPWVANQFAIVNYGRNISYLEKQSFNLDSFETINIKPKWKQIKVFYGGITGLIKNKLSREDLNKFILKIDPVNIEFKYDSLINKNLFSINYNISTNGLGEKYWESMIELKDYKVEGYAEIVCDNGTCFNSIYPNKWEEGFDENGSYRSAYRMETYDIINHIKIRCILNEKENIYNEVLKEFSNEFKYINTDESGMYVFPISKLKNVKSILQEIQKMNKLFRDEVKYLIIDDYEYLDVNDKDQILLLK